MPLCNKNYNQQGMFPNYCFSRSAKEPGYEVVKRSYMPKDSNHQNRRTSRHLTRSETYTASQHRLGNRNPDSTDFNGKRVKRSVRKPKKSTSIRRVDYESSSYKTKTTPPARSVEFRLPPVVCEMPDKELTSGQAGDESDGPREKAGHDHGDRNTDKEKDRITDIPQNDSNRDLQESCADFFSIIHDNVLEAVQGAVQRMIAKCFEKTIAQIAHLTDELTEQKALVNQLYKDVTSKLAEQNETNLNQFKFLTQMLIDHQTIHYRALSQVQQSKKRQKEELEFKLESQREKLREKDRRRRSSSSSERHCRSTAGDAKSKTQQHKLCQQQQPNIYHTQMCRNCNDLDANGKSRPRRQCSKIPKRLPKSNGTVSMPDLPRTQSAWSTNRAKKIQTPVDTGGGPVGQSSRHRFFISSRSSSVRRQPSTGTGDSYYRPRSCSRAKRKSTQQSNSAEPNMDDVRLKR